MKRSQPTLQHFFIKQPRINATEVENNLETLGNADPGLGNPRRHNSNENATHVDVDEYDIGHCWNSITDEKRMRLLKKPWVPPTNYAFPIIGQRKLKFQAKWIDAFNWLAYTKESGEGAVCKCCVLFVKHCVGKHAGQKTGALVSKPFTNWKKALEQFRDHQNASYHKEAVLFADDYINSKKKYIVQHCWYSGSNLKRQ